MSDIFDFGGDVPDVSASSLDDAGAALIGSTPDLSSLTGGFSAPLVAPPLSLPLPTSTGVTGILSDLTKLVTGVYSGEAQITAAQSAAAIAKAKAANQLATIKTTPNIWLVLGLGAAAVFALEVMDRQ
jgi:hypothetical protein